MAKYDKKNVLFISTRDYNLGDNDATLEKKFRGLGRGMNIFVLARGRGEQEKYGAKFYLVPKLGTVWWMLAALWRGYGLVKREKIDVIISQAPLFDGLTALILKKITRAELIVEVHSDWINSLLLQHKLPFKPILRYIFKHWGAFVLNRADKVRTVSLSLKTLVKANSRAENIYRFPAFSDLEMFLQEDDISYEPVIAYAGWLYPLKGIDVLIRAFAGLKEKYPELELEIIGAGPIRSELEALAGQNKIKDVRFTGQLGLEEVKNRLKRCLCLVLPSYSEGLPRILLEAAALKKPLLGTKIGGIPEIIQDGVNGFLVVPGNADELSAALKKLISDPRLAKAMGEAGRRIVKEKFAGEKYFENYFNMVN